MGMLDTSPSYLYFFIVPCYYIICFGCLMGFIMHFYIIFGTNLLTEGPVQILLFFVYFSVSQKRNMRRNPNRMKPSRGSFLEQTQSRRLGVEVKEAARRPRGRAACPHPRGPLVAPPIYFFRLYIYSYTLKTSRGATKPLFHRRNLLYP